MATPTITSTSVMVVATMRALERIAQRGKVSKSEALRRAIHASAEQQRPEDGDPLQASARSEARGA